MDADEELRESERTGKVVLGSNETLDATESGESKLTILSASCPRDIEEDLREIAAENETTLYYYPGDSQELGLALGKPFLVSSMAVLDPGESNVLELGEGSNED